MNSNQLYQFMDDESDLEMIPLISFEEEDATQAKKEEVIEKIPILPIKNTVLFPGVIIPLTISKEKIIKFVKKSYKENKPIGVIAQKDNQVEDPSANDLFKRGTLAFVLKMLVLPDGNTTIIIQGRKRFKVLSFLQKSPHITANIQTLKENFPSKSRKETKAIVQTLKDTALKILKLNPDIPQEAQTALENIESASFLTHFLSSNINAEVAEKQAILETEEGTERATKLLQYMNRDIQLLELKRDIQQRVTFDLDQQQKEYFLRQQIKVLQDELGEAGSLRELEDIRIKAEKTKWSKEVAEHFQKESDKLSRMNQMSAEYPILFNYLELLTDLPWGIYSEDNLNLQEAKKTLNQDHYGLEKVKQRIIEFLAVLKLRNDMKGPILCLYGPPGVGKTSLGKSIAKALNRKYARFSLGGVHDEAEIRGHRRTYIGAMPGKIVQNLKKVKTANPVILLDEIDKITSDLRGDPASALLEVLDPEQNYTFTDNYLEVPFDLSKVLFIATANTLDTIHPALRDRMEIIEINGYTLEEKIEIAKKYLIPKQRKEHNLKARDFKIDDKAIRKIIEHYTRESGVRNLERKIGAVIRKIATQIALEEPYEKTVQETDIENWLGAPVFDYEEYTDENVAGVVTGLAWTQTGGEILTIESSICQGKGKLTISGQLGDVMKESAAAALSYLRAIATQLGIAAEAFEQNDLHIHVPAGAVPKDGPSAGITLLTSLASAFTQRQVKKRLAMTGEITLTGKVLPVGGIKEKILAARRAGIKEVILCQKNEKDVLEIDEKYRHDLIFHYVKHAHEVLSIALLNEKVKKNL
ncbi:MAG: endopeptidase La [Cytophagales bacterium]|nr:MAG: endopeptidase La [Cytophagales bacterium]